MAIAKPLSSTLRSTAVIWSSENPLPLVLIKDGLLAILHDRLYQACTHYIEIGHIDLPGLKNVEYLYKSYHALGGNGTGTELYTRAKALPIRED